MARATTNKSSKGKTSRLRSTPSKRADGDALIGRDVIGQYVIKKQLGAGGMGAVYLADQVTVERPAVIKVLHGPLGKSHDVIARFSVEAKAASNLNHPNIITIYNYGAMDDGTLFLAMEYLEGKTLADLLDEHERLPAERAVAITLQIASALAEAHRHGVIHRDLKPTNIMVVERAGAPDFVKVLDFGIAKLDGQRMTSTGDVFGTPPYMSPEQFRGVKLDGRSDLYSTGILLYELLTGKLPFKADNPMAWMYQHADQPPPPLREVNKKAKVSPALEAVVQRALAKSPDDRWPTMEEFARDLKAALEPAAATAPATRGLSQPVATRTKKGPKTDKGAKAEKAAKAEKVAKAAKPQALAAATALPGKLAALLRGKSRDGWRARLAARLRRRKRERLLATTRGRVLAAACGVAVVGIVALIIVLGAGSSPAPAAAAPIDRATQPAKTAQPAKTEPTATPAPSPAKQSTKPRSTRRAPANAHN